MLEPSMRTRMAANVRWPFLPPRSVAPTAIQSFVPLNLRQLSGTLDGYCLATVWTPERESWGLMRAAYLEMTHTYDAVAVNPVDVAASGQDWVFDSCAMVWVSADDLAAAFSGLGVI